jgi:hypothetical protein
VQALRRQQQGSMVSGGTTRFNVSRESDMTKWLLILIAVSVGPASVFAADPVPEAVRNACQADYEQHCNSHPPESDAVRECMTNAFEKLSGPCVDAILSSDLVPQQEDAKGDKPSEAAASPPATASQQQVRKTASALSKPVSKIKAARRVAGRAVKPASRVANTKVKPAGKKKYAGNTRHRVASRPRSARTRIAVYFRRGPALANYYMKRIVSRSFARIFR